MFVKHVPGRVTKGSRRVKEAVEVYRTAYKPGQGTKQEYVARYTVPYGSLPTEPPTALIERLTDSEREQLSVWWEKFHETRASEQEVRNREVAISSIAYAARTLEPIKVEDLSTEQRTKLEEATLLLATQTARLLDGAGDKPKRTAPRKRAQQKPAAPAREKPPTKKKPSVSKSASRVASGKPPLPAGAPKPKQKNPTLARVSSVLNINNSGGAE